MSRGGKPIPWEVKVRRGTARPDRKPPLAGVLVPLGTTEPPTPPDDLSPSGRATWDRLWSAGSVWLHPHADWGAVAVTCWLGDCLGIAHARYLRTTEPADARAVVALSSAFSSALSTLGFDPAARARLGYTEVRRAGELERLLSRRRDERP